jgi:hypothetical protein
MINPRINPRDDVGGGGAAARQQQGYDPTLVGKRTGVTVPPRGQVTFDSPSSGDVLFENPDAFFAAARSGGKKQTCADDAGDNNGRRMSSEQMRASYHNINTVLTHIIISTIIFSIIKHESRLRSAFYFSLGSSVPGPGWDGTNKGHQS